MRGGRLRKRLQLQAYTTTADAHGTPVKVWTTAATVWGSIEPLSGKEGQIADGMQATRVTHRVTVRFYKGLNSKMRVLYVDAQVNPNANRIFEIQSILNTDERRIQHVMMCTEGKPNA